MKPITIVLADDHKMFREALKLSLSSVADILLVGEAGSGAETLAAVTATRPDVLILDIALPDMNGIEVAKELKQSFPALGIVALSGYADRMFVEEMLKAGAAAYVVKSAGADELVAAIRAVALGERYMSSDAQNSVMQGVVQKDTPPRSVLSPREQQVLRLLARGMRSTQIAQELGIAATTVEVHRRNIKEKLGLHSVVELTRYAIREGLAVA
ncbi:DNA-binding response regulator [Azonexus hydrophilus]|uniref:DNA-binding response regulator n=1 Tax=Azonexus hydrophilus TaxID=418702 RepID=A0A1R1IC82_9RHOO|nr:response regulator transcription factor [Azonexus hydrophilus]OMG56388.1 DNA-binding response regulator [Azonexus hydrophilus]